MKTEEAHRLKSMVEQVVEETREWGLSQELETHLTYFCRETYSLLDLMPKDTLVFLDEESRLEERAKVVAREFSESMTSRLEKGYLLPRQMEMLFPPEEIFGKLCGFRGVPSPLSRQRTGGSSGQGVTTSAARASAPTISILNCW